MMHMVIRLAAAVALLGAMKAGGMDTFASDLLWAANSRIEVAARR